MATIPSEDPTTSLTPPTAPDPAHDPNAWVRWWAWYKRASRPLQIGVGCASLFVVCALCTTAAGVLANAGSHGTPVAAVLQATSTATVPQATSMANVAQATSTAAATATPLSTKTPTPRPAPTATPAPPPPTATPVPQDCQVICNPWGYDFTAGNLIYSPDASFCGIFPCIPSFWNQTNGYVEECHDGDYSHSGGRSGSCSYHGGNWRPLYSH